MPFDVAAVQQALKAEGLDGWLLYDFHGSNPIAARLLGTAEAAKMTTRRWFYLVPADGEPKALVHAIERRTLDALPGEKIAYAGRRELEAGLTRLLAGVKKIAMEYSRECAIPYVSRVDAGTMSWCAGEASRWSRRGSRPAFSKRFGTSTRSSRIARHRRRSTASRIARSRRWRGACATGSTTTEFDIQQQMARWFTRRRACQRLRSGCGGAGKRGRTRTTCRRRQEPPDSRRRVRAAGPVGQEEIDRARCLPISRGSALPGRSVPAEMTRAFQAICDGAGCRSCSGTASRPRAAGPARMAGRSRGPLGARGRGLRGPDPAPDGPQSRASRCTATASTWTTTRPTTIGRLLPGTGFTIEPGVYFDSISAFARKSICSTASTRRCFTGQCRRKS